MSTFRIRVWVGPSFVEQCAKKLSESGFENVLEATEHVHLDVHADTYWDAVNRIAGALGFKPGRRNVESLRSWSWGNRGAIDLAD